MTTFVNGGGVIGLTILKTQYSMFTLFYPFRIRIFRVQINVLPVRWISDLNRKTNKQFQIYYIQLSYFYIIKIAKLNVISLLILVSISIGNPPNVNKEQSGDSTNVYNGKGSKIAKFSQCNLWVPGNINISSAGW